MLTLYHYPLSPCSEKIRYALALKGAEWKEINLDLAEKENLSADYLELNPTGCIPTLTNGKDVVTESTAILDYIEALIPSPPLLPVTPLQRASMRHWTKWVDEFLHPSWPGIAWVILVRPRWCQLGDEAVKKMVAKLPDVTRRERQLALYNQGFSSSLSNHAFDIFSQTLQRMKQALNNGPRLCGETTSIADISVLPYLTAARAFGILEEGFELSPSVNQWMQSITTIGELKPVLAPQITPTRAAEIRAVGEKSLQALANSNAEQIYRGIE